MSILQGDPGDRALEKHIVKGYWYRVGDAAWRVGPEACIRIVRALAASLVSRWPEPRCVSGLNLADAWIERPKITRPPKRVLDSVVDVVIESAEGRLAQPRQVADVVSSLLNMIAWVPRDRDPDSGRAAIAAGVPREVLKATREHPEYELGNAVDVTGRQAEECIGRATAVAAVCEGVIPWLIPASKPAATKSSPSNNASVFPKARRKNVSKRDRKQ